ncbi:MAG: BglII/BstYI family type II restriction endonuclease [Rhizobiaceae bacterium]
MTSEDDEDDNSSPEANVVELTPLAADDPKLVSDVIDSDLREKYKFVSYKKAISILQYGLRTEFEEIIEALRLFSITTEMIRKPGGNESEIPKEVRKLLRPKGWHETTISGDLHIARRWKELLKTNSKGKEVFDQRTQQIVRRNYLDGHKIDFVKNRLAFDFEWNSKDQTFDRDLYAFDAFAEAGAIDAAIIVTRDVSLNPIFAELGQALTKTGTPQFKDGMPVMLAAKYGASTTWWGKLIYRLNAGRNGSCPVLAVGITPRCISDLDDWRRAQKA